VAGGFFSYHQAANSAPKVSRMGPDQVAELANFHWASSLARRSRKCSNARRVKLTTGSAAVVEGRHAPGHVRSAESRRQQRSRGNLGRAAQATGQSNPAVCSSVVRPYFCPGGPL